MQTQEKSLQVLHGDPVEDQPQEYYLYADTSLTQTCHIMTAGLRQVTERHKVRLDIGDLQWTPNLAEKFAVSDVDGIVIGMCRGWPGLGCLRFAHKAIRSGRKICFYWPDEEAIELVDRERLRSYWKHWWVLCLHEHFIQPLTRRQFKAFGPVESSPALDHESVLVNECAAEVRNIIALADPVPLPVSTNNSESAFRISGLGAYLRTDFWTPITSGGSYGHTCYLASALSKVTERGLVCFLPHKYPLLDDLAVHQVALPNFRYSGESSLIEATGFYKNALRLALEALRPSFIYERLCLGNYSGAALSQELRIPYIVEYNGSEITMKRSFDGAGYFHEDLYLAVENAAFQQATLISVVSEPVKEDLVKRGVAPSKILVNPNGADVEAYAPVPAETKREWRKRLGWSDSDRVVGFTGTFGGWHGIEVLAQAIPEICRRIGEAKFLLIGDGNYKNLVDDEVKKHGLAERVHSTGRVPQQEGAALLRACDIYVSPHSRHMSGSRFFGSPTKIFEYMAMGGAIVASDLEQIGQVLSPALRPHVLAQPTVQIVDERAILCTPGDVEEFVRAVVFLLRNPEVCKHLGRNAREAVVQNFSWEHHVKRLCDFLGRNCNLPDDIKAQLEVVIDVEDVYKAEIQRQWDHNPCGSQYAKESEPETLEWFLEAESYRYGTYAPWMSEVMEFDRHRGDRVLEVGGGMGTDLAQFARHGAIVTDVDLSAGHLRLAERNFRLRDLEGRFVHHDAEQLPFDDGSFDVVYSNGAIHHTPNTVGIIEEMWRVLRPGGRAIVMVYAENSWHYWYQLVLNLGVAGGLLRDCSMGELMSRHVELSETNARPLVKVYTKRRLRKMFSKFEDIHILQRQMTAAELPSPLNKILSPAMAGKMMGWNLIVKGNKPRSKSDVALHHSG